MPQLIKHRRLVSDDPWHELDDSGSVPECDLIVPLYRYLEERDLFLRRGNGRTGLQVDGTVAAEDLRPWLRELDLIAIVFPAFSDGRGYSLARQLRQTHGYTGELRATGNVLRDQLAYLERVGFDSFLLEAGHKAHDALRAFTEFSGHYQNAPLEDLPRFQRRALVRAA